MTETPSIEPPPPSPKPALHLRKAGCASTTFVPEAPPIPVYHEPVAKEAPPQAGRSALGWVGYTQPAAWALFLLLGGLMAGIRYWGLLDLQYEFRTYGPFVILALYLAIVALAFKEDLFAGVLCVLIPGYGLYYLLNQAGRPFFTAVFFGLLAGLGEDSFLALSDISTRYYDIVMGFLTGTRK